MKRKVEYWLLQHGLQIFGGRSFAKADSEDVNGIAIRKTELNQLTGEFDLILANHAIEHVPEPEVALREIHRLLKAGRYAMV